MKTNFFFLLGRLHWRYILIKRNWSALLNFFLTAVGISKIESTVWWFVCIMILHINSLVYFHWQDQILELQGRFYGVLNCTHLNLIKASKTLKYNFVSEIACVAGRCLWFCERVALKASLLQPLQLLCFWFGQCEVEVSLVFKYSWVQQTPGTTIFHVLFNVLLLSL